MQSRSIRTQFKGRHKEVGKALTTVAKTVHVALAPISVLVWGYETIQDFVGRRVAEKLRDVPPERIVNPAPEIAGPALEALRYTGHNEELRELFANLLATALNSDTAAAAHPAFVEIIKVMSPDEAKILAQFVDTWNFPVIQIDVRFVEGGWKRPVRHYSDLGEHATCDHPEMISAYLGNLSRLGLLEIPRMESSTVLHDRSEYDNLEKSGYIQETMAEFNRLPNTTPTITYGTVSLTSFGRQFLAACVRGD